MKLNMSEEYCS